MNQVRLFENVKSKPSALLIVLCGLEQFVDRTYKAISVSLCLHQEAEGREVLIKAMLNYAKAGLVGLALLSSTEVSFSHYHKRRACLVCKMIYVSSLLLPAALE